ncbi:hypothetical protein FVEN_g12851 [Fusarium venenatum]|uniref:Uncharacterized protein n=1 Tax=Fusarium venenatum TaxID=56646 RepID=A0A2L2T3S7_9HYPO|nr:uncharacterized protein FVRRES_01914 [Fusarium venenatum]KAG8355832.1 hypothetical protein FVEN_g12851 [Fusarium venenatum]CEI65402.1 unnamed protein product [Fusarium venenatum]
MKPYFMDMSMTLARDPTKANPHDGITRRDYTFAHFKTVRTSDEEALSMAQEDTGCIKPKSVF